MIILKNRQIMKKLLVAMIIAALGTTGAFAQFEQGKWYTSASLSNFDMSYSELSDFSLGADLNAGYTIKDNMMVIGEVGFDYSNSVWGELYLGAKGRYYIEQNGLFLGAGVKYVHLKKSVNDVQITPEVGYCHFLNRHVTVEPSVYYNMSLTEFGDYSKFGFKIGLGIYF